MIKLNTDASLKHLLQENFKNSSAYTDNGFLIALVAREKRKARK